MKTKKSWLAGLLNYFFGFSGSRAFARRPEVAAYPSTPFDVPVSGQVKFVHLKYFLQWQHRLVQSGIKLQSMFCSFATPLSDTVILSI
jgi:hypothetical protein